MSLAGQTKMPATENHRLSDFSPAPSMASNQWSREFGHPDSIHFSDKRNADNHFESGCFQSTLNSQCTFNDQFSGQSTFNGHQANGQPTSSTFNYPPPSQYPVRQLNATNYYSPQNNSFYQWQQMQSTPPQQPPMQQPSSYCPPPSYPDPGQPNTYTPRYPTMFNGYSGDYRTNEQKPPNDNSTTVTYSNGLQPISHPQAHRLNGAYYRELPPRQSHPHQQANLYNSSNCCSSFNNHRYHSQLNSFASNLNSGQRLTSTPICHSGFSPIDELREIKIESVFFKEMVRQEQPKWFDLPTDPLQAKQIKKEKLDNLDELDELEISDLPDLIDLSQDSLILDGSLMDECPSSNEDLLMSDQAAPQASAIVRNSAAESSNVCSRRTRQTPKAMAATRMIASSTVDDSKKQITLAEVANVWKNLKKVKIERENRPIHYFKCSLCTYQTNTSQSMKDHLYCIHCNAKNNYLCNICQQTFGWKNNAQRHMRRKHKIEDQATKRAAIITLI
ncbi:hypothetical protein L1887_62321 [Cichorium endivia]|nr:hypothetical protein L1887_62321 [Cichorium endivia]